MPEGEQDEGAAQWERREWTQSLYEARDAGALPDALVLAFAARIAQGEELYCYRAAGDGGPWNLWCGGMRWYLATVVAAWREGRVTA